MEEGSEDILRALDRGEISADEAIRRLEEEPPLPGKLAPQEFDMPKRWPYLWLVPVSLGALGLFGGYGLATLGGWLWLLAAPLLLVGAVLFWLGLASIDSPWVHIQVQSEEDGSISQFGLSLPLPLRPVIWLIRQFGSYVPALDKTAVDELLVAMEATKDTDGPIFIDVHEGESGERVRVYLG